jgi:hypothetical protein
MLPRLNPIESPELVCMECGEVMRRTITKRGGRLDQIIHSCDSPKCCYSMAISQEHKNAQAIPYATPLPPVEKYQTADKPKEVKVAV